MATAITANVISTGIIRGRRLVVLRAAGSGAQTTAAALSPTASRLALTSTSDMATSTRFDEQHDRREHDHVDGEYEQRGVPDVSQQFEAGSQPAQPDCEYPGGDHHQRHRRDIDAEQVDLDEPHPGRPASK